MEGTSIVTISADLIEEVYGDVIELIGDNMIGLSDVTPVLARIMEYAGTFTDISGEQKKAIVIAVLQRIVDSTDKVTEPVREVLLPIVQYMVPGIIDSLISASKGNFIFKMKGKGCFSCF